MPYLILSHVTIPRRIYLTGGEDFDQRLVDHLVKVVKQKTKSDVRGDKRAMTKLRRAAEKAKRSLSSVHSTKVSKQFRWLVCWWWFCLRSYRSHGPTVVSACRYCAAHLCNWPVRIITASLAQWLRHPPRERKIPGSNPACAGIFFGGRVVPVT